jgi:hypothetical protein
MIQPELRETTPQRMDISIARRFFALDRQIEWRLGETEYRSVG